MTKSKPNPVRTIVATIAAGGSLSSAVNLNGGTPRGILMPAAWDAANLTFQVSLDNSTFYNVYNNAGEYAIANVDADRFVSMPEADFPNIAYIKVRSGTAGSAVNQTAESAMTFVYIEPE